MNHRNYEHDVHQIRSALHNPTGSTASLMVGSGFSFNSKRRFSSAPAFPSWRALTESLVKKLYPDAQKDRDRALSEAGATAGALRIAQEFEAAFGRTVLNNHIRELIPDRAYEPGPLHEALLKLPWADVFTTNYDTLLERSASVLRDQRYAIVRSSADLPLSKSPRIVKLHGTLPELNHCIITEEDYRTYPQKFGPFVADVQVAIVKTHMCLAGFSGDDPNFLAWSGWVRDRLGSQTLPIYLWLLHEPTRFQARLFEQRSIIPLPIGVITEANDYEDAMAKFLERLSQSNRTLPPKWCLPRHITNETSAKNEPDPSNDTNSFREAALRWYQDRQSYPGWVLPHRLAMESLWQSTEPWAGLAGSTSFRKLQFEPADLIFILSELVWRIQKSAVPLCDQLATQTIPQALRIFSAWRCSQGASSEDIQIKEVGAFAALPLTIGDLAMRELTLRCEILRHAREIGDFKTFDSTLEEIKQFQESLKLSEDSDESHFVMHQRALACLSTWNDAQLRDLLREWQTDSTPMWAVKRAGLLIELGDRLRGRQLLESAIKHLRSTAGEGTPETWSMETWAIFHLQSLDRAARFSEFAAEPSAKTITSSDVTGESGFLPYRIPDYARSKPSETEHSARRIRLEDVLKWLSSRYCDPREVLEWLDIENRLEVIPSEQRTLRKEFDNRRWTETVTWNAGQPWAKNRLVAPQRTLRVIEDTGQSLRSDSVTFFTFSLAESAIKSLAEHYARDVTGAVLRLRTKRAIEEWFTRRRVATLKGSDLRRLVAMAVQHLKSVSASTCTSPDSPLEQSRIEASLCLLSRLVVRLDDSEAEEILDFAKTLCAKLGHRHLVGEIPRLVSRACDCLSCDSFQRKLADFVQWPVPGMGELASLGANDRWSDPILLAGDRQFTGFCRTEEFVQSIDWCIDQLEEFSASNPVSLVRSGLVLRLIKLVNCKILDESQKYRIANALFRQRDERTGFPAGTGCYESVVLFLPQVVTDDELALFQLRYVRGPWPTDNRELLDFLSSLALTGQPQQSLSPEPTGRRHVVWTDGDLESIARSCSSILSDKITRAVELAQGETRPSSFPGMGLDLKRPIIRAVVDVYDKVILAGEVVPPSAWDIVVKSVLEAIGFQESVLRAFPRLLSFQAEESSNLRRLFVDRLIATLASTSDRVFKDGLSCLNHWANQLDDSRTPRIPYSFLSIVSSRLSSPYSRVSIDVIDTVRNLIQRLSHRQSSILYKQCEPAIATWSSRLSYDSTEFRRPSEFHDEQPDLRAAFTQLCIAAREKGFDSKILVSWFNEVLHDEMIEIRKLCSG
jgi:hypothetical protein